jgi:uncharacterized protein YegJ (DUF2314 family)
MWKMSFHAVAVTLATLAGLALDVPWWSFPVLIVASTICVHWAWTAAAARHLRHVGPFAMSPDDPIMIRARQEAKKSMDRLFELYPRHAEDTMVRFLLPIPGGDTECLWGDLLQVDGDNATVFLRTPPKQAVIITSRRMMIPVKAIDDWQIELRDGSLLGGFTNQAILKIYERENGSLHPAHREQEQRFRDRLDGAPFAGAAWRSASPGPPDGGRGQS